ncbi:MAG: RNA polymerase sigma factor [Aeromonas sp.]
MDADNLLQETLLRAIRQQGKFCAIENARAWLFDVARHLVIDKSRRQRPLQPLSDELAIQVEPGQRGSAKRVLIRAGAG